MIMSYPVELQTTVKVMKLTDPRLTNVWGDSLRRISYTSAEDAPAKGKYIFKIKEL